MSPLKNMYRTISQVYQSIKPSPVKKHYPKIRQLISPGDVIILRNYLLERIWPGYFSHAGFYIGNIANKKHMVLQVRAGGAELTTLKNFLSAKEAAVLSPHLTKTAVKKVVKHALRLTNASYDFSFDFKKSDKLSCTELIYVLYKKPLKLKLKKFMWTNIFTADQTLERPFQIKWISNSAIKSHTCHTQRPS